MTHEEMDYRTRHFENEHGGMITFFECAVYGGILGLGAIYIITLFL